MSKDFNQFFISFGSLFTIIGIAFLIIGILTNIKLKKHFSDFYKENLRSIQLALYGLSLPMIFRGLLNIYQYINPAFSDSLQTDYYPYFTVLNFFFGDLVPLCFQLSSLVYGYIRRKKNQKQKLQANLHNSRTAE